MRDVAYWPISSVAATQRFGRYRGTSGHCATIENRSLLTHTVGWLRDFGATQHVQRTAIPTYKCSISYSITSSARTRIAVDGSTLIALAVLRLMTNSNFTACSTGRSAGLAPLSILAT